MSVCVRPVPVVGDFIEILSLFGQTDLVHLQAEISAYECGSPLSPNLEEILQRADCLAAANQIMERIG